MIVNQPKALPFLCLTEMWERFGFYVVQGLLVLYITKEFGFSDTQSYTISGVFAALVYIAPMVGGFIADRIIGYKTAIIWGGLFLSFGYALLALVDQHGFFIALSTIIVGNGLFKPNISSLLGTLYPRGSQGRDTGFTIFYIGINLGVLISGLSGFILRYHGWPVVFLCASVGMLIGLLTFASGIRWSHMHYEKSFSPLSEKPLLHKAWLIFYFVMTIYLLSLLMQSYAISHWLLPTVGIFILFFIFILANQERSIENRYRLLTLNLLIISSVVFWMIFLQIFFAATLFIDRLVNKTVLGIDIPTNMFYTLESIFVIILGSIFAWSWHVLSRHNRNPSAFTKFTLAIAFVGLGFLTLAISTYYTDSHHLISPWWIVLSYFLITVGEMLLSPIGLSMVTTLAPTHLTGLMMGIWFVALGFGGEFAGWLAKLASIPEEATHDVLFQLVIYRNAFLYFAGIAFATSVLLFFIKQVFKKKLNML